MQVGAVKFSEVVLADFEFGAPPGQPPNPRCLVAYELVSGRTIRLWEDALVRQKTPPYPIDRDVLFVAYYAIAEVSCHLALGWQTPSRILDLYVEFLHLTNGHSTPFGKSQLGALAAFGLDGITTAEKDEMRKLALRGGPYTADEERALLEYCETDVDALRRLLPAMLPHIDVPKAVLRGRYMAAAARMEHHGIPIDTNALALLRRNWGDAQADLIRRIDADYGVYEGTTFKADRFAGYLARNNIPWLRLESGKLALDDETFRDMAHAYPVLNPLRELRSTLSRMHLEKLAVGADGRNRVMLRPFGAKTGRNAPSTSQFIFGTAAWIRKLIKPPAQHGLAYVDWEQQEFGIAAALSGDEAMLAAYKSGDPYLAFAKQAGAVSAGATKATAGPIRDQFKACALAVQYGMGPEALALRIGHPVMRARELLDLHRRSYHQFWRWSDRVVDYAMLKLHLHTVFGWTIHITGNSNSRSLRNFPMQANGAEMLRLACCYATERGIRVCAPVHDALLIEAPIDELEAAVASTRAAMAQASADVLFGFELRSEAKVVTHPDSYTDERGQRMWEVVWGIVNELERGRHAHSCSAQMCANAHVGVHGRTPALSLISSHLFLEKGIP